MRVQRSSSNLFGLLSYFAYFIFIISIVLATGVFIYGQILSRQQAKEDADLAQAESKIDLPTVESFVHLRDRLTVGESLLDKHVAFSNFFAAIGPMLPENVRFSSLGISFDTTSGAPVISGSGVAKSFNALAVVSTAFATDPRIKDAIFSKITINDVDNTVSFDLSASLDPKIVAYSGNAAPAAAATAAAAAASSTPAATSTSP